jgi:hypothetical protein
MLLFIRIFIFEFFVYVLGVGYDFLDVLECGEFASPVWEIGHRRGGGLGRVFGVEEILLEFLTF